MFKSNEERNAYMREWKKNFRKEDILTAREIDRTNRRKWVRKNKERAKQYMNSYFKKWLNEGCNRKIHGVRTKISSLKSYLLKYPKCELKEGNLKLLDNLTKIGWNLKTKKCVNHIVSLKILLEWNENLPMEVLCDYRNMELCDRVINSRAVKRTVNKKVIATAISLEKSFPKELAGFSEHVKSLEGATI